MRLCPLLLLAALAPARAAQEPLIGAPQVLAAAQEGLKLAPQGPEALKLLGDRGITLSIVSPQGLGAGRRFISLWQAPKKTIAFNVEILEGVYAELEAAGEFEPRRIGAEMGLKLAPSLAHEACHVRLALELQAMTGLSVPDSIEEEALCLGEELAARRALTEKKAWQTGRSRTDLDRLEDRVAWVLLGEGGELRARAAEHYPGLLSFGEERQKSLSLQKSGQPPLFSILAVNRAKFEAALDELEKRIRAGGAGLLEDQEGYAKNEQLSRRSEELRTDRPEREGGDAKVLASAAAYERVRAYLDARLQDLGKELSGPAWRAWAEKEYPGWFYDKAVGGEDKLRWALAAALKSAKSGGDLFLEGNPYYLRHARRLAAQLGRDIGADEKEIMVLEEAKIRRELDAADKLSRRGDDASRKWSLRLLRRAGVESRETWDMPPYWLSHTQDEVYQRLQKALKAAP